jgi:hypothetical protein
MPPLGEQEAIVSFLDRETAKIDDLVAEQQRLIELVQEKAGGRDLPRSHEGPRPGRANEGQRR